MSFITILIVKIILHRRSPLKAQSGGGGLNQPALLLEKSGFLIQWLMVDPFRPPAIFIRVSITTPIAPALKN
jgi:hypothetical protein